jgi:hypothetical protein
LKVLDPRISYEGLQADCEDSVSMQHELDSAKDQLKNYFQANYARRTPPARPTTSSTGDSPTQASGPTRSPQKVDFTARYKKRARVFDEFDEYFRLPLEVFEGCDPIQWWFSRRVQYPNLSRLALDVLSIPGMFKFLFV